MLEEKKKFVLADRGGDTTKTWYVWWIDQGERQRSSKGLKTAKTKKARYQAAKELIEELEAKEYREKPLLLIQEYIEDYKLLWRKKTYQEYCSKLNLLWDFLREHSLHLDQDGIKAYFRHLLRSGKSATTYNNHRTKLRHLIREAIGIDLLTDVKKVQAQAVPAKYFTAAQVQEIIQALRCDADMQDVLLAVQLMYYCFIRPNELRHLRASDIDIKGKKILIRASVSKNKKQQYVAIPKHFLEELTAHVQGIPQRAYIITKCEKIIGRDTLSKKHARKIKALGFDTSLYKFYSWKHTGAVMATKAGIGMKQLQLQLRHHSLDQVNMYLRQMGLSDMQQLEDNFPGI